jgi:hypothetical protein
MTKINQTRKTKRSKQRATLPRDVIAQWATWSPNYGGSDIAEVDCFAMEIPFGLMNMQTTGSIGDAGWSNVKKYRFSKAVATFHLPLFTNSTPDLGKVRPEEMFIGWNKTPATLQQTTTTTFQGYHAYKDRCDVVRTSGTASSLTLSLPLSGWRKYLSVALYTKYKDLLDRQLSEYTYGSVIVGFFGYGTSIKKEQIASFLQTAGLQECLLAKAA